MHPAGAEHEHGADFRIALHPEHEFDATNHLLRNEDLFEWFSEFREILLQAPICKPQIIFAADAQDDASDIRFVGDFGGKDLEHHGKTDASGGTQGIADSTRNDLARACNAIASQKLLRTGLVEHRQFPGCAAAARKDRRYVRLRFRCN